MRFLRRVPLLIVTFGVIFVCFLHYVRPWYLSWGATSEEQQARLPGDELVRGVSAQNTRAITIHANIERVWPWLAQIGQDRAGFYSFERLEDLVGCEMPPSDTLRADLQAWKLGDRLWMYPSHKANGAGFATLRTLVPGRALGFGTRMMGTGLDEPENGSWSFVLVPVDDATTRLLIRGRTNFDRSLAGLAFDRLIFEPVHFVMERRMMAGLAGTIEGHPPSRLADDIQIALWVIAFGLIGVSKILVVFSASWKRPLAGFAASLVVFQILTLGQPHVLVGACLVAGVAAVLWWPRRARTARERVGHAATADVIAPQPSGAGAR